MACFLHEFGIEDVKGRVLRCQESICWQRRRASGKRGFQARMSPEVLVLAWLQQGGKTRVPQREKGREEADTDFLS
jgi:hypothetical protein